MSDSFIVCNNCKSEYNVDRFSSIIDRPLKCIDCSDELYKFEEIYNSSDIKFNICKSDEYYFNINYDIELLFDKLVKCKDKNINSLDLKSFIYYIIFDLNDINVFKLVCLYYISLFNKINIYLICICYLLCFYDNRYNYMFVLQLLYYDLFIYQIIISLLSFKNMLLYIILLNIIMFSFIINLYFDTLINKIFALKMLMFYLFNVFYCIIVFINVIKISFFRCFYNSKLDDFLSLFLKRVY